MLLAGSSGNLRRSVINLIAFKHKIQVLTPTVVRNPTSRDFNKDLKFFM
jgi:hypothetical protein